MSLLRFADLGVSYGERPVLAGIDLAVAAGEVVALVGRSGSGKSTLAAAAIGLLPPDARTTGRILLAGRDVTALTEREWRPLRGAQVAAVFQEPALALNPARRIGGQIAEAAAVHRRLDRAGTDALVARLLAEVGLDVPADRFPGELSGGQRQRVAIAAALAADPKLLLADEPTAALDPAARAGILALLVRLARTRGVGVLLVSHDLALVAGAADRVAVLDGGRLVETGPVATTLAAPCSPRLRALVAADAPAAPPPPPRAAPPLLTLAGVARRFGHGTAGLTGIDLAIRPGETVALLGASGAGKTTLARLVLGLDRPDAGEVRLAGLARGPRDRHPPRGWAGLVQAVFQDPAESLDPSWTIGRSVAEPVRRSPDRAMLVADALARVGLPAEVAGRRPAALSGGERQRAALARALVRQPQVLVLDEALSALDPELRAELAGLLLQLQQAHGLAYLLVTHDHRLAGRLAHRALVLAAGRVVADGSAAALLAARPV